MSGQRPVRKHRLNTYSASVVHVGQGGHLAPSEPEHREQPEAEPIHATPEELAQQLASDPEFREWVRAERMATTGALMGGALR